jgi:hypothetical protein
VNITIWHRADPPDTPPSTPDEQAAIIEQSRRGYRPGDDITQVFAYTLDTEPGEITPEVIGALAEQAFRMFNGFPITPWELAQTQRYRAGGNRSLSVGDVVVFGEVALTCEPFDWTPVTLPSGTEA